MTTGKEKRTRSLASAGALLSDLVAGVFALSSEGETGAARRKRVAEVLATLHALEAIVAKESTGA